jgi:hypothetical protein
MTVKLTKRTVDAIVPGDRASIVYDTDLKGFGVRVAPNGSLSWFVEYRPGAGGRRVAKKRMVIGSREFTPEQARQAAKGILASISLGSDPVAVRREERESETFREFAERYLREEAEAKLKLGTVVTGLVSRPNVKRKVGHVDNVFRDGNVVRLIVSNSPHRPSVAVSPSAIFQLRGFTRARQCASMSRT